MKISCNILKKHIKNSEDIDFLNIWDKFTIRTAEVEGVEVKGSQFDGVVTAKIIEVKDHPKSTKLHILKVDAGTEILDIVCGAPNVRVGLISALVKIGGHIDGMEITRRPLLGIDSNGMMCSGKELGISDDHSGILELPEDTKVGADFKELFPVNDIIVEIDNKSLTHRPDLWGHYGIAREIASITHHELKPLELFDGQNGSNEKLNITIDNPELCYRYVGTKISNINNVVTPMWMQIFLYYAGMRSINLLVDLTNYIMLELGQPMHAFDSRVVKNIEIGLANNNDTYITLDGQERKLTHEDLMIKNGGKYFAIAGIMGGLDSEIVADTNGIVLESATFEASTVRKTAIRLGLRTEASARYEKSLDPNMAMTATKRFIKLLKDENPDIILDSEITDVYPTVQTNNIIELEKNYLYKYMGFDIDDKTVIDILESLEFVVENKIDKFIITVPTFRSTKDITMAADIIEEISRMYGYENFNHIPLKMDLTFKNPEKTYDLEYEVKNYLATKYNMNEVHTYLWNKSSFLKKINVTIDNVKLLGKTEDNTLRNNLSLSLLESAAVNVNNFEEINIFEIGTTIVNDEAERHLCILNMTNENNLKAKYYELKSVVYNIFKNLKNEEVTFSKTTLNNYYNNDLSLNIIANNEIVGYITVFNKHTIAGINKKKSFICVDINFDIFEKLPLNTFIYEGVSKYPTTNLDYTINAPKNMNYETFAKIISNYQNDIILNHELIDIYENEEIKKITIRFKVGSKEKTLTSEELDNFKNNFIKYIEENNLSITL